MKKNLFVLILLCAMSVIQVNAGENPAVRREYDFTSFNAIRTVSDGQAVGIFTFELRYGYFFIFFTSSRALPACLISKRSMSSLSHTSIMTL